MFNASVEQWRGEVLRRWATAGYAWSPSQYLAVIQRESNGSTTALSSANALGLGQVMPGTLAYYRTATGDAASDYATNAATQIKVGSWVYNQGIRKARSITLDPGCQDPHALRFALADCCYSVGAGTVNRMLAALGKPPKTLEEIEAAMPVPLPGNRPYIHARAVAVLAKSDGRYPYVVSGWPADASIFDDGSGSPVDDHAPDNATAPDETPPALDVGPVGALDLILIVAGVALIIGVVFAASR
jgi:hypothetical protein